MSVDPLAPALPRQQLRKIVLGVTVALVVILLISNGGRKPDEAKNDTLRQMRADQAKASPVGDTSHTLKILADQAANAAHNTPSANAQAPAAPKVAEASSTPANPAASAGGASAKNADSTATGPCAVLDLQDAPDGAGEPRCHMTVDQYKDARDAAQRQNEAVATAAKARAQHARIAFYEYSDSQTVTPPVQVSQSALNSTDEYQQSLDALRTARSRPTSAEVSAGAILPTDHMASGDEEGTHQATPTVDERNRKFLTDVSKSKTEAPLTAVSAPSPYMLQQGKGLIPCAMVRGVNTDMPGQASCVVTRNVYDSITGDHVLIPWGTVAVGPYQSEVVQGESLVLAAFSRLIFPNGASADLGAMAGSDRQGNAGLPATVNNHFWRQFGSSFLVAGLAGLIRGPNAGAGTNVVVSSGGSQGLTTAAGQVLVQVTQQMLAGTQNIKPTFTTYPGQLIYIVVARDLNLNPAITMAPPPTAPR